MQHFYWLLLQAAQTPAPGAPAGGAGAPGTESTQAPPAGCGAGGMQPFIVMLLMFAVFYFILIRPQQKRAKEHSAMLNAVGKGDMIITRGGVIGKVTGVADNVITIETQEKVRQRILKSYVDGKYTEPGSKAADKPAAKAGKDEPAAESKS